MIYMDNAATTPIKQCALEAMNDVYKNNWYNPSSFYRGGMIAKQILESSRERIACCINAEPEEIIFTSGGTESDNMALSQPSRFLIVSNIEHHAIGRCAERRSPIIMKTDKAGFVIYREDNAIPQNFLPYALISVMLINNEIGTIQPIKDICDYFHSFGSLVHTDAVQAVGHYWIDVKDMDVDMLSASAHKFGGPRGVGFLYIRKGLSCSLMYGGDQEFGERPGTENLPAIVGMTAALCEANSKIDENWGRILELASYMRHKVIEEIKNVTLNGSQFKRYPGNLNFCFHGVRGEQLLEFLNQNEIYASSGSACNTTSDEPSHVLKAIGLSDEDASSSIRFSLSENNTKEEVDKVVEVLKRSVNILRGI